MRSFSVSAMQPHHVLTQLFITLQIGIIQHQKYKVKS